ncbi:DUF6037 family protein (plasmid) [Bacillus sp. F19]|nr:DUF6037 family protein [Bacillus sp. F19]
MELTGLKPLYSSMIELNLKRTKFSVIINNAVFEFIYFIDSLPHSLAIGVRNNNLYYEIEVKNGFRINPYLGEKYAQIYKILGLSPKGSSPFSPSKFYVEINKRIPTSTSSTNIPKTSDIAPFRRNVEEPDKIYFYGWRDNTTRKENVSAENLKKTRQWLGIEAYEMCKKHNISSCWTAEKSKEKLYGKPSKKVNI